MNCNLESTGLSSETTKKIHDIFRQYPDINQVLLYGSRAKGNYHKGSDIDLTIMGDDFSPSKLARLETEIDDLFLPYKVDLSLFRQIKNRDLVDHIQRVGINFYFIKVENTKR